jgi:hypothetical protein
MSLSTMCPSCRVRLKVHDRVRRSNKPLKCPKCGTAFTLTFPTRPVPDHPRRRRGNPRRQPGSLSGRTVLLVCSLVTLVGLGLAGGVWVWLVAQAPGRKERRVATPSRQTVSSAGRKADHGQPQHPPPAGLATSHQPAIPKPQQTPLPAPSPSQPHPKENKPAHPRPALSGLVDASAWKADRSPEKWRRRILAYTPYDGKGRYTMGQRDGVAEIQGLEALAQRFGEKPYRELQLAEQHWQTERVIFRDVDTGATLVRLTNDPWTDELSYFGHNWSADGKYVVFRRRPGMYERSTDTHGPMAVNSDGTGLRNVFRDYRMVRNETCSPTDPNTCFAIADTRKLIAFDLGTGKTNQVIRAIDRSWHLKVSPDGKYLMGRSRIADGGRGLWVARADGQEYYEISEPRGIHDSYRFHPTEKKIMYWHEGHFNEGFILRDLDGSNLKKIPLAFDWNHGDLGPDRGVHTLGHITRIQGDSWLPKEVLFHQPGVEYYDQPYKYNGYVTWMPKDQYWVHNTRLVLPPYLSELHSFHAEPVPGDVVNRFRICYTNVRKPGCLDHPAASPDGTKVLFNSNMLGRVDIYYVIARLPEPPRDLRARRASGGGNAGGNPVELTWSPARHHAETAGYHVYRSAESGVHYVPITAQPVREPRFLDHSAPAGEAIFYKVSAVEHSGLESRLSDEVAVEAGPEVKRRLVVEAEEGQRNRLMWLAHLGLASNLHYVWQRQPGKGQVTLSVDLPEAKGPAMLVWARVKGEKGVDLEAEAGGDKVTLQAPPLKDWTWVKFKGVLPLKPGSHSQVQLIVTSSLYGSAIDRLVLTTDSSFSPQDAVEIRWPGREPIQNLKAQASSPYAVKVAWPRPGGSTLHHYNVYCGEEKDFPVDQSTLIASPDRHECLDWGLKPGTTYYYRVTWVDRGGNESLPSPAVEATTPGVERVILSVKPADRKGPPLRGDVRVPRAGIYVLWLKLKMGQGGGEYLNLDVDGERFATWTITFDQLSEEAWFSYGKWGRIPLKAGPHVLTIENNTKHTVQEIMLTNDLSFQPPQGHVNTLRGW